jgi:hypothetical protein
MADPISSFGRARPKGPAPLPPKRRIDAPEPSGAPAEDPLDAELRAWNAARPRRPFPWRQFSLISGLCFGAGSLVLPDSINDAARYALYVIAAIGFFGGFWRRPKRPEPGKAS